MCVVVWVVGFAWWERVQLRRSFPVEAGEIAVRGLAAPVSIVRDGVGIPHILARNDKDAWTALGFVQAQERLAQMLWLRAAALGRLAELTGEKGLPADREARLLGIAYYAEREAKRLDADSLAVLTAFSEGVNARLDRIRHGEANLPFALVDEGIEVLEDWRPADSLALVKLYAWGLGGSAESSLVYHRLIERLGGFGAAPFLPDSKGEGTPPGRQREAQRGLELRHTMADFDFSALRHSVGLRGRNVGSSAWVVSGENTASGYPLLAADVHLEPTAPLLFMEIELRSEGFDVAGVTIPGVPIFWSGRNQRVAWASVGLGAVTSDLRIETLDSEGQRFRDGRKWRAFTERTERIRVKGSDDVEMVIRGTGRGPLLQPWFASDSEPLSLAWVGARSGNGISALLRAMRARSVEEFRKDLALHAEPALTFVIADVAGDIGLQVAGSLPQRIEPTKRVPVPSRTSGYRWQGLIPFSVLPTRSGGGPDGWLIASDEPLSNWEALGKIEWRSRNGFRAARIRKLLVEQSSEGLLDLDKMTRIQRDTRSSLAPVLVERVISSIGPNPPTQGGASSEYLSEELLLALQKLRNWDGELGRESEEAAAYHVFVQLLFQNLFAKSMGDELFRLYVALPATDVEAVLLHVLERSWSEIAEPWARPAFQREAIRRSLEECGRRMGPHLGSGATPRWGDLHTLRFMPLLGKRPRSWELLKPLSIGGDGHTVWAAGFDVVDPYRVRVASMYRWAVDLRDLSQARTALAPGASEHPGHPHYADGVKRWRSGGAHAFPMGEALPSAPSSTSLRLIPAD